MLFIANTRKINFPMLWKVLGWLLMIESLFMVFPTAASIFYGESDWEPLAFAATVTFLSGFCLNYFIKPERSSMAKREGFLLTALVWILFSLFGMIPFMLCSSPLSFTDAFYEAMAGFTTTGTTSYTEFNNISHGIHLWRALMQWLGGMGIILFTLAVLPMLNHAGGMQMFNAEVTGITHDKIRPRISQTAKSLWGVYAALTLLCCLLLWAGPMSLFESVCHAFGTISTGGFSTRTAGVCDWDSIYIYVVITVFMLLGGTNFSLIYFAAHRKFAPLRSNGTLRAYLSIILAMYVVFVVGITLRGVLFNWRDATIFPLFQIVASMTSTGYTAPDLPTWGPFALFLILPLMFFGACAGSTSGGAKIDRMLVLGKYLRNSLKKALNPNNITSVKIDGKVLAPDIVSKTIAFLCLYGITAAVGAMLLAMMGVEVFDGCFFALSCMSNLGIGPDAAGAGCGVDAIPYAGKWVLSALMLIGRLEIFTILIIFSPSFWRK